MDLPDWLKDKDVRTRIDRISHAPFASMMGMELVSLTEDGEARVRMDVDGKENALGNAHGGIIFALADQALAISSNIDEHVQVAMTCHISYIKPIKGTMEAVARKLSETNSTAIFEVRIFHEEELMALFQATTYKIRKKVF